MPEISGVQVAFQTNATDTISTDVPTTIGLSDRAGTPAFSLVPENAVQKLWVVRAALQNISEVFASESQVLFGSTRMALQGSRSEFPNFSPGNIENGSSLASIFALTGNGSDALTVTQRSTNAFTDAAISGLAMVGVPTSSLLDFQSQESTNGDTAITTPSSGLTVVGSELVWTPTDAVEYALFGTVEMVGGGSGDSLQVQFELNGTTIQQATFKDIGQSGYQLGYCFAVPRTLTTSEQTLRIRVNGDLSGGAFARRVRLFAFQAASFGQFGSAQSSAGLEITTRPTEESLPGASVSIDAPDEDTIALAFFTGETQQNMFIGLHLDRGGTEFAHTGAESVNNGDGATDDHLAQCAIGVWEQPDSAGTTVTVELETVGDFGDIATLGRVRGNTGTSPTGDVAQDIMVMVLSQPESEETTGTAALDIPVLTLAASGTEALAGTAAAAMPVFSMAATGNADGTAAGSADLETPVHALAATASLALAGTMAATIPVHAMASTGALDVAGDFAGDIPVLALEALESGLDPLAQFDDSFDDETYRAQWQQLHPEALSTDEPVGGEAHTVLIEGGIEGSHWFDDREGPLRFINTLISGPFDARIRIRVRNAAGDDSPSADTDEFRFAGLAIHDPDRTTVLNYVHVMIGSDPSGQNRLEWKTTDDSDSTFDSEAGSGPLDYDLRIIRVVQIVQCFTRRTDEGEPLGSDESWDLLQTVDRDSNATPPRTTAVNLPADLQVGFVGGYAGGQTLADIQSFVEEFRLRTVTEPDATADLSIPVETLAASGAFAMDGTMAGAVPVLELASSGDAGAIGGTFSGSMPALAMGASGAIEMPGAFAGAMPVLALSSVGSSDGSSIGIVSALVTLPQLSSVGSLSEDGSFAGAIPVPALLSISGEIDSGQVAAVSTNEFELSLIEAILGITPTEPINRAVRWKHVRDKSRSGSMAGRSFEVLWGTTEPVEGGTTGDGNYEVQSEIIIMTDYRGEFREHDLGLVVGMDHLDLLEMIQENLDPIIDGNLGGESLGNTVDGENSMRVNHSFIVRWYRRRRSAG